MLYKFEYKTKDKIVMSLISLTQLILQMLKT